MNRNDIACLKSLSGEFRISLSDFQTGLLEIFLDELWSWNQKMNLTGLSTMADIIRELLMDSMLPGVHMPDAGRYLDVGSGAGFPGIPLAVCKPELDVTLLEPMAKRCTFLTHVIRLLKLSHVRVIRGRIEQCGRLLHPGGYHIITARALARFPQVVEWLAPHLGPDGILISFQGTGVKELLQKNAETLRKRGIELSGILPYTLPVKGRQRNILLFKKI